MFGREGMASSNQHLASVAGLSALQRGGSAGDACVAMAGVLGVLEPCSTGIGGAPLPPFSLSFTLCVGDMFALYYSAKTGKVCFGALRCV